LSIIVLWQLFTHWTGLAFTQCLVIAIPVIYKKLMAWKTIGITFTDSMLSDGSEMVNMMEFESLTATDITPRDGYDSNTCICALNATEN